MWNESSNKEVSVITSLKRDLYLQCLSSVAPIPTRKVFQNPNFVNNLEKKSSSTDNLTKNYRKSISNCPKVIPYYQVEMGNSDISNQQDIHLENSGMVDDKLINIPPESDREGDEVFIKPNTILPLKCNVIVSCDIENSKENTNTTSENKPSQIKETQTQLFSVNDMTACTKTHQQRIPSICESEDSFIVFEGSDDSSDENDDTDSDEDSDDEDDPGNSISSVCHINHKDCNKKDSLKVNGNTVLMCKKTDNEEQVKFNNSKKQRIPSVCESEDSFIVFEGNNDDDDSLDEDSDESEDDTDLSSHKVSQPQVNNIKKKTEKEYNDSHSNINVKHFRQRIPSTCESEDSFILFERTDNENVINDSVDSESLCEESYDEIDACIHKKSEDFPESYCIPKIKHKKVSFAPREKLCKVYPMIRWSYAYQAARKGPWEMHARDRTRFKDRINRTENELKSILNCKHRDNIYKERFAMHN